MELAEQKHQTADVRTEVDLEAQAEAFHGEIYQRMRRIKEAAGKLSHAFFVHGEEAPEVEEALRNFDELVYPMGMNSKTAAENAPAFRLIEGETGELQLQQVDPHTLEPITD